MKKRLTLLALSLVIALGAFSISALAATRETEPNDSNGTAIKLTVNHEYVGNIQSTSDKDYYVFTLSQDDIISVTFNCIENPSKIRINLYDSSSNRIFYKAFEQDRTIVPWTSDSYDLAAGTYYLLVEKEGGYATVSNADYYITVNAEYTVGGGSGVDPNNGKVSSSTTSVSASPIREVEANDSTGTATKMAANQSYVGAMASTSDKDYYAFTMTKNDMVAITFNCAEHPSKLRITLYDSASTRLFYKAFDMDSTFVPWTSNRYNLPPGTYYLLIEKEGGYSTVSSADYTLTVNTAMNDSIVTPNTPTTPETPTTPTTPEIPETPTTPTTPETPSGTDFKSTESLNVGVKFKWPSMSGGVGYRIYRSDVAGTEGISVTDFYITDTQFIDVNVDANKTYYYTLRQVIAEARPLEGQKEILGPPSAQIKVTTQSSLVGGNASSSEKPKQFIIMTIDDPYMSINGLRMEIDPGRGTTPVILNSRTMVPIRAIVEGMGGTVGWNSSSKEISLAYGGFAVKMWQDSKSITVNGASGAMDIAPTILNDRTMLPLRFAAENLGCEVEWLNSTRQVVVIFR